MSDPPAPPPAASLRHVLLAVAEPRAAAYLKTALQLHGFTVWCAADAAAALRLLAAHDPPLIGLALLDADLPGAAVPDLLTGLLRLSPGLRCAVMGDAAAAEAARWRQAGAVNVVGKPPGLADLSYSLWGLQRPAAGTD